MKITHLERSTPHSGKTYRSIATFDLELSDDVRIFGLKLVEAPDGARLVYAPSGNGGRRLATFSPDLSKRIAIIATKKMEGANYGHGAITPN